MELTRPHLRLGDFHASDWQAVHTFTADPAAVQFMPRDEQLTTTPSAAIVSKVYVVALFS